MYRKGKSYLVILCFLNQNIYLHVSIFSVFIYFHKQTKKCLIQLNMLVLFQDRQNQNEENELCQSKPCQQIPLLHVFIWVNPSSVYINLYLGRRMQLSHDVRFSFEGFDDEDSYLVLGQPCTNNSMSTPNQNIIIPPSGSIPNIPSISTNDFPSQQFSTRRRLQFKVKEVRADADLKIGK